MAKKRFFTNHAKSSAALISLGIHVALIIGALFFVAVTVINKDEVEFEPKPVNRPAIKLKKLRVPVKSKDQRPPPKLRKNILAKPKRKSMEIQMPEIVGVKGGLGATGGDGFGLGFGFGLELDSLFGGDKAFGNELEGTFFDLKLDRDGDPAEMDEKYYKEVLRQFCSSWNIRRFERKYFMAPKKKYATMFMLPIMRAEEAPKAYGVEDVVKPKQWVAFYTGHIAPPETGRYRFWGIADDVLMVRINRKLVIDANYPGMDITEWSSDDERNRKYKMSGQGLVVGDWFRLKKGVPAEMEVLVGERPGGWFFCHLLIEQEGVEYPTGADGRPILPVFKTEKIPEKLLPQMKVNRGEAAIDGPIFGQMK
jgi:hypothetical protein